MMIADVIRQSRTEHEVYFLLTAYIDAVRFGDKVDCLSESMTLLPLTGIGDVSERFDRLIGELDAASRQLDDKACEAIKEALHIFGVALKRLRSPSGEQHRSLTEIPPNVAQSNPRFQLPNSPFYNEWSST